MKKTILTLVALCLTAWCAPAMAQHTPGCTTAESVASHYTNLPVTLGQPQLPSIPDTRVILTDFGAKGDGITLCTDAFAQAIEHLSQKGGGHLVVPDGIWLTAPITMRSNIDINIARNAIILFTPDKTLHANKSNKTKKAVVPGIHAYDCHDISITGSGTIDGNGAYWRPVKRSKVSDYEWKRFTQMGGTLSEKGDVWYPYNLKGVANMEKTPSKEANTRADLVRFEDCQRVLIDGVTVQNSPRFHVHPCYCEDVVVTNVTIRCPWNAQNGDALDLTNCRKALLAHNTIDCGDDGLCMKAGIGEKGLKDGPCKDILIIDNTVLHAHGGFVIGSDVSGGMENIVVKNNRFMGTDIGLRFKSSYGRGGATKNIYIEDIYMTDILDDAIHFETTYENKQIGVDANGGATQLFAPDFKDIHIKRVTCRGAENAISAHGEEGMVHDITIENSTFYYKKNATDIDDACKITTRNVTMTKGI